MKMAANRMLFLLLGFVLLGSINFLQAAEAMKDSDGDGVPDDYDLFPCDPEKAALLYAPSQSGHGMLALEGEWPRAGNLDFNDAVVTYNYVFFLDALNRAVEMRATFNALAMGGEGNFGIALQLPVSEEEIASVTRRIGAGAKEKHYYSPEGLATVMVISENIRELFNFKQGLINAEPEAEIASGAPVELAIKFNPPILLDTGEAPYDLYFFKTENYGHQIHLPKYPGTSDMDISLFKTYDDGSDKNRYFVDSYGVPFVLHIPEIAPWTEEGTPIDRLFPMIIQFALSGGERWKAFYRYPVVKKKAWHSGEFIPEPQFAAPQTMEIDNSCL